jgi:glutamate racemase
LVENNEISGKAAHYIVEKDLRLLTAMAAKIDTVVLACTHYPLLLSVIREHLPHHITILSQGEIVAEKLVDYLHRHREMDDKCGKNGTTSFYTTDEVGAFEDKTAIFYGKTIRAAYIDVRKKG